MSFVIAKKEVRSLAREKTFLLIIAIQLFVASFSAFLVVGLLTYLSPDALKDYKTQRIGLAVVGSEGSESLLDLIHEENKFRVVQTKSFTDATNLFFGRKVDGVLVITASKDKPTKLDLFLPKADMKATLIVAFLKAPLEKYESLLRAERAGALEEGLKKAMTYEVEIPDITKPSSYFEFIYGMLVPLLILAPALVSGGLVIDLIAQEREQGTVELLRASPLSMSQVVNGKALVAVAIAPVQALAWLLLLSANKIAVYNKPLLLVFILIFSAILVFAGALLALRYDRGAAHFLYSLLLLNIFADSYLLPEVSPMGLIGKIALDAAWAKEAYLFAAYAALAALLYLYLRRYAKRTE